MRNARKRRAKRLDRKRREEFNGQASNEVYVVTFIGQSSYHNGVHTTSRNVLVRPVSLPLTVPAWRVPRRG